jgi:hydroxymethylbilane synthase
VAQRLATRGSRLALAQAQTVAELLGGAELVPASSDGEPGDKSRFVRAVERELLEGRAEIGVHSAKDLPAQMPPGLVIAGAATREVPQDAWVGEAATLDEVPPDARVGTSSLRRRSQLLAMRPDLEVTELHGNVDTRLRRLEEGELDAIVLAAAGLRRLGREDAVAFVIDAAQMTPAAGQGVLALQVRADDLAAAEAAQEISDPETMAELTAERAVVAALDATCNTPVGVHAVHDGARITIEGFAGLPDGSEWVRERHDGDAADPAAAGKELARKLLAAGAGAILERAESAVSSDERRTAGNGR